MRITFQSIFLVAHLVLFLPVARAQVPPPPDPGRAAFEAQTRGPVHEAFASVSDGKFAASPAVRQAPPPPLNEAPADMKPDGDDVEWIGGYWQWSEELSNFLWVSGCWRNSPPDRDWLPGQWAKLDDGFHWVSGAWIPEGTERLVFLPQPPQPVEEEPGMAPAENQFYAPGTWVWKENRYVWRPGQWVEQPEDWVWQAPQYLWTPSGFVFVDGYWDHPLAERGLLFAPVLAGRPISAAIAYTPQYVIRPAFLETAMFVSPTWRHYYYGDYFTPQYRNAGFLPWYDFNLARGVLSPLFFQYMWSRRNTNWNRDLRNLYSARYSGGAPRPPATWRQQEEVLRAARNRPEVERQLAVLANAQQPTATMQQITNLKIQQVTKEQKQRSEDLSKQRQAAAKVIQEQTARSAASPKAPVELKVPNLTRAPQRGPATPINPDPPKPPKPTPAPKPSDPPKNVNPPKPPAPMPPTPAQPQPRTLPQRSQKPAPPPPKFQPEREVPRRDPSPAQPPKADPPKPVPQPQPQPKKENPGKGKGPNTKD